MKKCPYCAELIQEEAIKCRYCGEFLDGRPRPAAAPLGIYGVYWGYEYRSKTEVFGWPLVHIAQGFNPETGQRRVARGIIAIGDIAIGGLALGGLAAGGITFGGLSLGLIAIGGVAIGGAVLGGMSIGVFLAIGGLALSLFYAAGGLALAQHTISGLGADPEMLRLLERFWQGLNK